MRRLAPYGGFLVTFMVIGIVAGLLVGWIMTGQLLGGVAEAALVAVALSVAFALLARLLALTPPLTGQTRSRTVDTHKSAGTRSQQDPARKPPSCEQSHDVCKDAGGRT